jgi:hypothetical protein
MPMPDHGAMNFSTTSRAGMALLLVAVLAFGVVLGSAIAAFGLGGEAPTPTTTPTPFPSSVANADLPHADAEGHELARLPRYPGSVRTEYEISIDDRYRLTAVEYLADAGIEEVRAFYQRVMDQHGWEVADITYAAGEWTYVLVDGRTEALVELEQWNGLIEVDLQISESIAPPNADPTHSTQPATQAPGPDDDGDDDDDDDDGDEDDDREDDTEG